MITAVVPMYSLIFRMSMKDILRISMHFSRKPSGEDPQRRVDTLSYLLPVPKKHPHREFSFSDNIE